MNITQALIPITLFLCSFAVIFVLRYLASKERMAMIERGMHPNSIIPNKAIVNSFSSLKFGLLFFGAGLGLFTAYILEYFVFNDDKSNAVLYMSLIAMFGGLGLLISYNIEKADKIKDLND